MVLGMRSDEEVGEYPSSAATGISVPSPGFPRGRGVRFIERPEPYAESVQGHTG
jgi:hypothetical protein